MTNTRADYKANGCPLMAYISTILHEWHDWHRMGFYFFYKLQA
jgi:hypothetical protein